MKKIWILVFFSFLSFRLNDQLDFEAYAQKIAGTSLEFQMVPIPGGSFKMGSDSPDFSDQNPAHEVKIDPFWIGAHEVTWDVFELFLDKNFEESMTEGGVEAQVDGLTRPSLPYLDMTFGMGKEGKPAVGMTQYGAVQFCHWLYLKTGIFYRLPTEAEWEYAARAGSNTRFFFGEDSQELDSYAWTASNSGEQTHPVGTKKPNPWGIYDIYGNVQEWTIDQYDPEFYSRSPKDNPVNKPANLYPHSVRGGSFKTPEDQIGSAYRSASDPYWKRIDPQIPKSQWWFPEAPFMGLRVVRPLNPPSDAEIQAYFNQEPIADY
ncbi:formylglycine-generating enzyme family protein [Algoriphagus confluentis]|uniref:Formylglycine-generating enzyme family protein n=1 Tax=Algoriphagus confluentis TaxID=1697556 RepID=A0ABQ6PLU1_9BACT|nr:formylglycine-generating enzyme family protein [Algoriphagus confluentis]